MTIFDNPKELAHYLVERKITFKQFCLAYFLSPESRYADKYDIPFERKNGQVAFYKATDYIVKYAQYDKAWKKEDINNLVKHDLIINKNEEGQFHQDNFEVTEKFLSLVFEEKDTQNMRELFDEFWNTYPAFMEVDGKEFVLRSVDKDEVYEIYQDKASDTSAEDINDALKVAKGKGQVKNRIDKWLKGEFYNEYMDEIDNVGNTSQVTTTII